MTRKTTTSTHHLVKNITRIRNMPQIQININTDMKRPPRNQQKSFMQGGAPTSYTWRKNHGLINIGNRGHFTLYLQLVFGPTLCTPKRTSCSSGYLVKAKEDETSKHFKASPWLKSWDPRTRRNNDNFPLNPGCLIRILTRWAPGSRYNLWNHSYN